MMSWLIFFRLRMKTKTHPLKFNGLESRAKCDVSGGVSVVAVQYVASVGNAGAETVEVLLRNGMAAPVSFVRAELDGTELPPVKPMAQRALSAFRFDVGGTRPKSPVQQPVAGARWWQFYPSPDIPAGGHAAFQLNFAERSRACNLVLTAADGRAIPVQDGSGPAWPLMRFPASGSRSGAAIPVSRSRPSP